MPEAPPALVVIGASTRAFAASARDAGWRVHAADLFCDLDLRAAAAATACARDFPGGYPRGIVAAARTLPPGPFCYVGAMENHLDVVRTIARERPLLGSPPAAVTAVRDPRSLRRLVRSAGLEFPACHAAPDGLPTDGSYLRKPLAGAGGRGITPWLGDEIDKAEPCVWQRRIAGASWSAAFVIGPETARLLGASRQLTGLDWCHARPFTYCGSIDVPLANLQPSLRRQFAALAAPLAGCGLRGAVGVDIVVDDHDVAWVIEVNPRPTASMELIERSAATSIAAAHVAACGGPAAVAAPARPADPRRWAKAVLYAPHLLAGDAACLAPVAALRDRWVDAAGWPGIADEPAPGRAIPAGGPVCTLLAAAGSGEEAVAELRRRAAILTAALSPPCVGERRPATTRGHTP
jgi:predicted ATP-grasp superfamily ATP-dependent carboligase